MTLIFMKQGVEMHNKKKKNNKGFSLTDVLIVTAIIAGAAAVSFPIYNRVRLNARAEELQQILTRVQADLKNIYLEQNPNEYPPVNIFPNGLTTWATPTNLQTIQDLVDLVNHYCANYGQHSTAPFQCSYTLPGAAIIGGTTPPEFNLTFTSPGLSACVSPNGKYTIFGTREGICDTFASAVPGGHGS